MSPNYVPWGKIVTATYIHKALAKIHRGLGLKDHVGTELVFCQADAQEAIAAAIFSNWWWRKDVFLK
jgi:hypothetical protein